MSDFQAVFAKLRPLLSKFKSQLLLVQDTADGYSLHTHVKHNKTDNYYFGGLQIKKNYVSYHLMGIYIFPDLLEDLSPALKKRMQGKSCFNFTKVDETLFAELAALTEKSFERMKREGLVSEQA